MWCVEWIFPSDAHTMRRGGLAMKPVARTQPAKRPVNLLLNEATVQQARVFTRNLSSTVDVLLADYVARQQAEQSVRQQLGDTVAETWNAFHAAQGSFADEYSTL
jgi:post-segregation antitoxin (ccd killing protein)